jgi:hypothetical protein
VDAHPDARRADRETFCQHGPMSTSPPSEAEGNEGQPVDPVAALLHLKLRDAASAAMRAGATPDEVTADLTKRLERLRRRNTEGWTAASESTQRDAVIAEVVARILSLRRGHPIRVAISGPIGAGFVDELAGALGTRATRTVVRVDLRELNHDAVRAVLRSLGPGGDLRLGNDSTERSVPNDAILLAMAASVVADDSTDWDLRVAVRPYAAEDRADARVEAPNSVNLVVRLSD